MSQNTSGKMESVCADSFSALLHPMMLSGQKGNMSKNDKIQLADAHIECLIKSCIKRLSWALIFRLSSTSLSLL